MTQDIRPAMDAHEVREILEGCIGHSPQSVRRISSGQISSTFECLANGEPYIVQFNEPDMAAGLTIERRFSKRLSEAGIPLRQVICDGEHDELRWTVTRKAVGERMTALTRDACEGALPSVFDTLIALSAVDVTDTVGYGWMDENAMGGWETWEAHLSFVREEEPVGMFYGKWHGLFDTTFLERDRFDEYFREMAQLSEGIRAPRRLVHGGFGYDNVLIHEGQVSAVLDWQDARFGDPLLDVAYLDFWPSGFDLVELYESHCGKKGLSHENYRHRILCYKYYIGLDAMRFFARTENRGAYDQVVEIVEDLKNGL
jgi:hygromycin-B 4-O-kinase